MRATPRGPRSPRPWRTTERERLSSTAHTQRPLSRYALVLSRRMSCIEDNPKAQALAPELFMLGLSPALAPELFMLGLSPARQPCQPVYTYIRTYTHICSSRAWFRPPGHGLDIPGHGLDLPGHGLELQGMVYTSRAWFRAPGHGLHLQGMV